MCTYYTHVYRHALACSACPADLALRESSACPALRALGEVIPGRKNKKGHVLMSLAADWKKIPPFPPSYPVCRMQGQLCKDTLE